VKRLSRRGPGGGIGNAKRKWAGERKREER
jgi:hypothetical protein